MIRFHLAKLIADKGFRERRRVELAEVSDATGIHRSTLSRVLNKPGANLTAENMGRLCAFFGCSLGELAEYVVDEAHPASARTAPRAPATSTASKAEADRKAARKVAARNLTTKAAARKTDRKSVTQ